MNALVLVPLLLVTAVAPNNENAKLFTDNGSLYFRTDNQKALTVGSELDVVVDSASPKPVGKAVIMELNGKLARVSLDDAAKKDGAKFVLIPKPKLAAGPVAPAKPTGPKLNGTLEWGTLRVNVANNSDSSWTGCELRHSDGRSYKLGEMVKHSDDAVMKVKFGMAPSPLYDHLVVTCAEGESTFLFSKPTAPVGTLKGYAVNEGKGSVVVYNSTDTAWTRCDVKKPDRSHYVLGTLKGHSDDSINGGRFVKEAESAGFVELRCKEGWLKQAIE